MLETVVNWGRLLVVGQLPGSAVPEAVLPEIGKGELGAPRLDVPRLLAEMMPSDDVDLLAGTAILSPTRLEESLKSSVSDHSAVQSAAEVLRFEEICLPDRNDADRRRIRRVVFIAVEWSHKRNLADFLQALSDSASNVRD